MSYNNELPATDNDSAHFIGRVGVFKYIETRNEPSGSTKVNHRKRKAAYR